MSDVSCGIRIAELEVALANALAAHAWQEERTREYTRQLEAALVAERLEVAALTRRLRDLAPSEYLDDDDHPRPRAHPLSALRIVHRACIKANDG